MQQVVLQLRSLVRHAVLLAVMLAAGVRLADAQSAIYGAGLQGWLAVGTTHTIAGDPSARVAATGSAAQQPSHPWSPAP